jgi:hypothetical protein
VLAGGSASAPSCPTFLLLVLAAAVGERLGIPGRWRSWSPGWTQRCLRSPPGNGERSLCRPPLRAFRHRWPLPTLAEGSPRPSGRLSIPNRCSAPDAPLSPGPPLRRRIPVRTSPRSAIARRVAHASRSGLIDGPAAADASTRWRPRGSRQPGCGWSPAVASLTNGFATKPRGRWRSAEALGKIGPDARPVPSLAAAIRDADTLIRGEAAKPSACWARTLKPWRRSPRGSATDAGFRREAVKALARIGPPRPVAALVEALRTRTSSSAPNRLGPRPDRPRSEGGDSRPDRGRPDPSSCGARGLGSLEEDRGIVTGFPGACHEVA